MSLTKELLRDKKWIIHAVQGFCLLSRMQERWPLFAHPKPMECLDLLQRVARESFEPVLHTEETFTCWCCFEQKKGRCIARNPLRVRKRRTCLLCAFIRALYSVGLNATSFVMEGCAAQSCLRSMLVQEITEADDSQGYVYADFASEQESLYSFYSESGSFANRLLNPITYHVVVNGIDSSVILRNDILTVVKRYVDEHGLLVKYNDFKKARSDSLSRKKLKISHE